MLTDCEKSHCRQYILAAFSPQPPSTKGVARRIANDYLLYLTIRVLNARDMAPEM